MKGPIIKCVEEMVTEKYGADKWQAVLAEAGLKKSPGMFQNVPDAETMKLLQATCKVLRLPMEQAADAFGEHWMTVYAPRTYEYFFSSAPNLREFLLRMDGLHTIVTGMMTDAHPPRFEYEWKDPKTLHMTYRSERNLIVFAAGLARGAAKYFKEPLSVTVLSPTVLKLVFL